MKWFVFGFLILCASGCGVYQTKKDADAEGERLKVAEGMMGALDEDADATFAVDARQDKELVALRTKVDALSGTQDKFGQDLNAVNTALGKDGERFVVLASMKNALGYDTPEVLTLEMRTELKTILRERKDAAEKKKNPPTVLPVSPVGQGFEQAVGGQGIYVPDVAPPTQHAPPAINNFRVIDEGECVMSGCQVCYRHLKHKRSGRFFLWKCHKGRRRCAVLYASTWVPELGDYDWRPVSVPPGFPPPYY